jgi:type II secretory ATPase GspE/PulE/Tfp pilus assembly ATPase PilB-like protein
MNMLLDISWTYILEHVQCKGEYMPILVIAKHSPGVMLLSTSDFFSSLPFSPIKLAVLIVWVYICLYFVQLALLSPFVPKKIRTIVSLATLFAGPFPLFLLLVIDTAVKATENQSSILTIAKEQLQNLVARLRFSRFSSLKDNTQIRLLDSLGRELKEIFGQDKHEKRNPILDLTEQMIANALDARATDILIDPKDDFNYIVRYRVDGVLNIAYKLKSGQCEAVINSIKVISSMDIAEKRRPQDGSFTAKTPETTASFRVASAGVRSGEKLSVRVLNQGASKFTLANIGISRKQQEIISKAVKKPSGMILICGPTSSGKTTTMYAMLNEIDFSTRNVITVEDPIEYTLPNASQIEVNPKANITFANSLRSILRQNPDVICVGEIRDEETAEIALRASQTGHLVLATVHSTSNNTALLRLLDLGISPMTIASGLDLLVSQRLLRKLCHKCKQPIRLSEKHLHDLRQSNISYENIFQAGGCRQCNNTGYYERIAITDILVLSAEIKDSIACNPAFIREVRKTGEQKGKGNLKKQALKMVVSGITSFDELRRVVG